MEDIVKSCNGVEFSVKKQVKTRGILQSEELYKYILETSVYPREPELLKELREASDSHPKSSMVSSPLEGQLLGFLLKILNPKKSIEIGVFTGYSLLVTALSIPNDGKIIAIDVDRKAYDQIGFPIVQKAGVEHKIDFVVSEGLLALDNLLQEKENEETFDFAFVDADKQNNKMYHEKLMRLVKVGGIIAYDNTLWGGTVTMPESEVPEYMRLFRESFIEFNKILALDPRIEISHLPAGDGITFCKRLY